MICMGTFIFLSLCNYSHDVFDKFLLICHARFCLDNRNLPRLGHGTIGAVKMRILYSLPLRVLSPFQGEVRERWHSGGVIPGA